MSDIIKLLPDSVANQIAAGEVIQRPASVVKELMENSIDAGATYIQVILKDAGRTLIQIIDNGKGMSMTDARLSFERHATSKIRKADDLFSLTTMGFRGEALASIAAIAQVELRTKRPEDEIGTLISISGSEIEKQESIMCADGSNFMIKNIFFNVPARRKFLKTNQTELSNIITEFERIALVNQEISFVLIHNDNEIMNLQSVNPRQRIMNIFGRSLNNQLLSVDVNTSLINISGYIGRPEAARKKNPLQFFFVNGRYMRHPYFNKAVTESYQQLIPQGEMPNYFLYLSIDPANIDVNIHPTKTEIKFENESYIWQIINAAVKEALGKFSAVPSIDFDMADAPEIPVFKTDGLHTPKPNFDSQYNPFKKEKSPSNSNWQKLYQKEPVTKKEVYDPFKSNDVPDFSTFKGDNLDEEINKESNNERFSKEFETNPDFFHSDMIFPSSSNDKEVIISNQSSAESEFSDEEEITFVSKISTEQIDNNPEIIDEDSTSEGSETETLFVSKISSGSTFDNVLKTDDSEYNDENSETFNQDDIATDDFQVIEFKIKGFESFDGNDKFIPEAKNDDIENTENIESQNFVSKISQPVIEENNKGIFTETTYSGGIHYQFKGKYILTSVKSGLMLIDQHRAHTRVLFEKYMDNISSRQGVSQGILFPEIIEISPSDIAILEEISDDLSFLGFEISNLGAGAYSINGIPSGLEGVNYIELIHLMIDNAKSNGKSIGNEIHEMLSLTLAKAAAIPYGEMLNIDAMERLIESLFSTSMPNYTPDGKTIVTVFSNDEIFKRFK